jgi:hypothetical protein
MLSNAPFSSAAALTFRAVYILETKRAENDRRVVALYIDMRRMMEALLE